MAARPPAVIAQTISGNSALVYSRSLDGGGCIIIMIRAGRTNGPANRSPILQKGTDMSKSGRLLKGKKVVFRGDSTRGLTRNATYTLIRSFVRDKEAHYKVRDRSGNMHEAPEFFFDLVK